MILLYRTLVTGQRVAVFFQERVVGRPYKQRGKGKGTGKDGGRSTQEGMTSMITGEEVRTVGWKTLEQYLCALVFLQKQQMAATGKVIHSPRRFPSIIEMMATLSRTNAARKKSSFADRCKGMQSLP